MSLSILPGTKETLNNMKGQQFVPHKGEGVVYIKLTFIKPETMQKGDPATVVANAAGVVLCGQLSEIRDQLNKWFDETSIQYQAQPPQKRF